MSEPILEGQDLEKGIGRIQRVGLRDVWSHEALDFTKWLEDNADVVADATGLQLSVVEREQPAGAFSVDLIAEDEDGRLLSRTSWRRAIMITWVSSSPTL